MLPLCIPMEPPARPMEHLELRTVHRARHMPRPMGHMASKGTLMDTQTTTPHTKPFLCLSTTRKRSRLGLSLQRGGKVPRTQFASGRRRQPRKSRTSVSNLSFTVSSLIYFTVINIIIEGTVGWFECCATSTCRIVWTTAFFHLVLGPFLEQPFFPRIFLFTLLEICQEEYQDTFWTRLDHSATCFFFIRALCCVHLLAYMLLTHDLTGQ